MDDRLNDLERRLCQLENNSHNLQNAARDTENVRGEVRDLFARHTRLMDSELANVRTELRGVRGDAHHAVVELRSELGALHRRIGEGEGRTSATMAALEERLRRAEHAREMAEAHADAQGQQLARLSASDCSEAARGVVAALEGWRRDAGLVLPSDLLEALGGLKAVLEL